MLFTRNLFDLFTGLTLPRHGAPSFIVIRGLDGLSRDMAPCTPAIGLSRDVSRSGQLLDVPHFPMLGFCVEQHGADPLLANSGFRHLIEAYSKLASGEILSSQPTDERTERTRPPRLMIETSRNLLKQHTALTASTATFPWPAKASLITNTSSNNLLRGRRTTPSTR